MSLRKRNAKIIEDEYDDFVDRVYHKSKSQHLDKSQNKTNKSN